MHDGVVHPSTRVNPERRVLDIAVLTYRIFELWEDVRCTCCVAEMIGPGLAPMRRVSGVLPEAVARAAARVGCVDVRAPHRRAASLSAGS